MSYLDEYNALKKLRTSSNTSTTKQKKSYLDEYNELKKKKTVNVLPTPTKASVFTPITTKDEEEEERTWFKSGALSDGYQFGDITKTILGSVKDVEVNAVAGIAGMGEKAVDAMAFLAPYQMQSDTLTSIPLTEKGRQLQTLQNERIEEAKQGMAKFIQKDLYDEKKVAEFLVTNSFSKNYEANSVFGEKSDALVQSGGQLLATAGLQAVGVPWFVTTGVTSFGAETENALNQGATMEQAGLSAAISAGAEILTEKISGGIKFGGKTLDDALTKQLARRISDKTVRTLAKFGVDAVGEGTEEVLSSVLSNIGSSLYKEESIGELLTSEEAMDEYLESFIGGAVLGGVSSGSRAIASTVNGIDFASEMTNEEKAVVDKIYKDAIAEREADGTKLTNKEKSKIYDETLKALEKGYIDIDTIASVVGGEEYSRYNAITEQEKAAKAEYDALYQMKLGDKSDAQIDRQAQLKKQLEDTNTNKSKLKEQLDSKVFGIAQNSKLSESYNEKTRKGQAFEADLTQYDAKQQEIVKKAVESGILNNSNRTHDFVDMIAKISADKGVSFDFTNNQKLKESGFAIEGKTVNGFIQDGNVSLNIDSPKALNSVVGHEITHVLEGTELYSELQKVIKDYATTKGEYDSRYKAMAELYKDVKGADIDAEITADLVGDYLFTDSDFINNLSTENPGLFKKIFEEIKYLYKLATAGSKEARQLEKAKKAFENAYRDSTDVVEENEMDSDVQYSISVTDKETLNSLNEQLARGEYDPDTNPNGGYYTTYKSMSFWGYDDDGNAILRSPMAEYVDGELSGAYLIPKDKSKINWYQATETIDENTGLPTGLLVKTKLPGRKSYSYLPASENQHLINEDWSNLYFNLRKKVFENGKWKNSDVPARYNPYEHSSNSMLNDQFTAAHKRDNLVTVKMIVPVSEDNGTYRAKWSKDPTGWADWKSGIVAGKINEQKDLQRRVYLSRYAAPVEIVPDSEVAQAYKSYVEGTDVAIPDNVVPPNLLNELKKAGVKIEESGKVQYSLSDSDGNQLSKEQQEYFKNSKARDENGNLMVVYHGSKDYGFTVFDPRKSDDGTSLFFTNDADMANTYVNDKEKLYKSYLNLENPYVVDAKGHRWNQIRLGENTDAITGKVERFVDLSMRFDNEIDFSTVSDSLGSLSESLEYMLEEDALNGEDALYTESEQAELRSLAKTIDEAYENWDEDAHLDEDGEPMSMSVYLLDHKLSTKYNTRQIAKIAKEQGHDGVIIENVYDNGKFASDIGVHGFGNVYIAFDSNQVKNVDNTNPTSNPDIRFSLSEDSEGRQLAPAIQKRFENSKAVDENGNLKVLYHGTASGEFSIFDKSKGSVEGDFGSGFYFTDNDADVSEHYEGGGPDFENKVARLAEQIEQEEDIDYAEAEERARAELYKGSHKFEVYLNIENPAVVGETILFDLDSYFSEYDPDDYDSEEDYESDVEQHISDEIDNIIWGIERNVDVYSTDGIAEVLWEAINEGGIDIEGLKAKINDLYLEDEYGNMVGNEVTRQIIESLGYDGIIDPTVSGKWNMEMEEGTTHYIVFKPNQIKAITNENPTDNPDIHRSVSDATAPQKSYGNYNVYGRDLALELPVAPEPSISPLEVETAENRAKTSINEPDTEFGQFVDDYAPLTEEQANARDDKQIDEHYFVDVETPEVEAPYDGTYANHVKPADPFFERDIIDVGKRNVKAYMFENPEVKPYFQEEANYMLGELYNSVKGEKSYNDKLYYETGGEMGFFGTKRHTSEDIAYLLDEFNYTYKDIEKGLKAIIEDDGKENNAISKRIEFLLDERLRKGYKEFIFGGKIPPNQDYINLLNSKQISEYNDEAWNNWLYSLSEDDVNTYFRADRIREGLEAPPEEYAPVIQTEAPTVQPDTTTAQAETPTVQNATEDSQVAEQKKPKLSEMTYSQKLEHFKNELKKNEEYLSESQARFEREIEELQEKLNSKKDQNSKVANNLKRSIERKKRIKDGVYIDYARRISNLKTKIAELKAEGDKPKRLTRSELHANIVNNIKSVFDNDGYNFDDVLKKAKNLSTFATVDNTPQRVMEKALGYKEGQILSDMTVDQVARNETEGIKWLNSFTDRKNGLLAQLSKQYNIKPGSKESAAAQMYAEGFYVNEDNEIIQYGDTELAKDFPDQKTQANIKGLASDPRIRQIYDETLGMINDSRSRNLYPEIQRLDNYFLHFRAMDDTFSRLGLPFNPNDIRAKDLPTDLNGVTADLKPGQPYFASAKHRTGKRTSFDLLGGLEKYLTSAKNQIYHIDDIQTLRALRNYIADTYGQANGLEGLDALSEEEAQERIEQVYGSHLSTFAKFLNEEANILAGKTALIDRGIEGIIGRRGITFLNSINKQVGSNMVGFNVSSSLTNALPVVQTFAKTNKFDFTKAFAQTVFSKIQSMHGKTDSFVENNPTLIRRKGADRFYRTPFEKIGDVGYSLMSAVDSVSSEIIVRAKYNELTRKGMSHEQAEVEADKWVSRLMGDRSLGQQPQLYNSKMLGILTKFQLEVRNQLDSQFYDTIQEAKVSNEHIQNELERNIKTVAKVTSTLVQLAVAQHLFGKAFESVAGYNPAFDIIEALLKTIGYDDEEDSEDTVLDNIEEGFLTLLEDLPYTSTFTGGRIPISSALPIEELIKGEDEYGNEKSRWQTLGEIAPYYVLPGGYGQLKKTAQGLAMFDDDLPISGSYTDSGNLRFPVEDTTANRIQAGIFGQWASENARDYFDNERSPLKEKQIEEFIEVDLPIRDYWEYREGLSGLENLSEQADYINSLDLPIEKKNILINNLTDRKEPIDLTGFDEDFANFEEFDFAVNNPEKYEIALAVGGYESYKEYKEGMKDMKLAEKVDYVAGLDLTTEQKNALINGETDRKEPIDLTGYENYGSLDELDFARENPGKHAISKVVGDFNTYKSYLDELNDIRADKDANGESISGSAKEKKTAYINSLDMDYGQKIILYRSLYDSKADKNAYNADIVEYLDSRDDISYEEMVTILEELGMTVHPDGTVTW